MRTAGRTLPAARSFPRGPCPPRDKELIASSCSLLCGSAFPGPSLPGGRGGGKTAQSCTLGFQHSSALGLGVFLEPRCPHLELGVTIVPPGEGRRDRAGHTQKARASAVPECPHCAREGRAPQSRPPHSGPGLPLQCSSPCPGA